MRNEKEHSRIADNPSARTASNALKLAKATRFTTGLFKTLPIKNENVDRLHQATDAVVNQSDIFDLPDRFNDAFSDEGWIATDSMSVEVMRKAIELSESGSKQEAEEVILNWFRQEAIALFAIQRSKRFSKSRKRWDQLQEALKLTFEERYWSAIPLILIACDGFASDVLGTSPFEKDADLTVFDSVVGHPTSLPNLIRKVTKGVRKSTDDKLTLPLRHGILHGQSLGYANRTVCMKAWLLMIALVDWAYDKATENERIQAQDSASKVSLSDVASSVRKLDEDKRVIAAFEPRETSEPIKADLDENSPEYAIVDFLRCWKTRNYGKMAERSVNLSKHSITKMAGELHHDGELVKLQDFDVRLVRQITVARADAVAFLRAKTLTGNVEGEFSLVAFRYSEGGNIAMPDDQGKWLVQEACIYHVLHGRTISDMAT